MVRVHSRFSGTGPADDVVRAARGVRRVARSVRRAPQTERRGLADIVVDVVRRPSGARGCHQIGAAVHQRYRARYVWPMLACRRWSQ